MIITHIGIFHFIKIVFYLQNKKAEGQAWDAPECCSHIWDICGRESVTVMKVMLLLIQWHLVYMST